jgi:hypothetical protein
MTGYWTKSFDVGVITRTAKVYISPEPPIRSYFTVIAVPDAADPAKFFGTSSWRDVADERDEALFVLQPGPGGWGDTEAEAGQDRSAGATVFDVLVLSSLLFLGLGRSAEPASGYHHGHGPSPAGTGTTLSPHLEQSHRYRTWPHIRSS